MPHECQKCSLISLIQPCEACNMFKYIKKWLDKEQERRVFQALFNQEKGNCQEGKQ